MMKPIRISLFAVGVAYGSLVAAGCGAGADTSQSTTLDPSVSGALSAVQNCQDQERGCFTDGGGQACADALRSCLMSSVPGAGGPPSTNPGSGNAGGPPSTPPGLADGGNPNAADPDPGDGGGPARPPLPDAAIAALTKPIGGDSGAAAIPCVEALRSCLATAAQPESCADQARTCLMATHDAGPRGASGDR